MTFNRAPGTLRGVCTSLKCFWNKNKPIATHYNRRERRWVCVWCCQQENGREMNMGIARDKLSCISGQQYVYEELMR